MALGKSLEAQPRALRELDNTVSVANASLSEAVTALAQQVAQLSAEMADRDATYKHEFDRVITVLRHLHDEEQRSRDRLEAMRVEPSYELAYSDPEPLVSVIIPTHNNYTALAERAIPSVLAQTHRNFELVIVGDGAPPQTAAAAAGFDDARISYENLPLRGDYPNGYWESWMVSGSVPYNVGVRRAVGHWIAPFADDDALRPRALESMLAAVREHRYELCYGVLQAHSTTRGEVRIGKWPPEEGELGLQGGIHHAGLRFLEAELVDAPLMRANDWSFVQRAWRAGARIGFLDEVVCDYYPSRW
jgi:hypothetical protein